MDALVTCINEELSTRSHELKEHHIDTIYLGGGTPSLLEISQISEILETTYRHYRISNSPEITIEANPDDLITEKSKAWRKLSINRLSLGIQSFDDEVLKFMNRNHVSDQAMTAFGTARTTGFDNISIDLIYGVQGSEPSRWSQDLDKGLELGPDHISAYALTVEENTVLGRWVAKGLLKDTDENQIESEYFTLCQRTAEAGFAHYEVSNFCKPGFESRHNSSYWSDVPYIGIGPGAHSYNRPIRSFNISNNVKYIQSIRKGSLPSTTERLDDNQTYYEYLLTSLRTHTGISPKFIHEQWPNAFGDLQKEYFIALASKGYCVVASDHIRLTNKGMLFADQFVLELIG